MHTFNESGGSVPAFLAKLWRLVEDPSTNKLICWSKDGLSFIIQNQSKFARELLPLNYKHNNMASFIRQLNMYGFHKIASVDNGGLKFDRDDIEFSHPCFKRGCSYLLEHIKRKIANTKIIDEKTTMKPETVDKVLTEVKAMRGRQESLDSRFNAIKQENEVLWSEIATLRQKHMKQQQIVNKLIQFLVTMVQQPSRNMSGVKRNFQLMINDSPQNDKLKKATETISGPIIHELTEELLDGVAETDPDLISLSPSLSPASNRLKTESPMAQIELFNDSSNMQYDQSSQSADDTLWQSGTINTRIEQDGSTITYHVTEVPDESANDQYYLNNDNSKIPKSETDNEMSDLQELYMYQIQQQEAEHKIKKEEEQKSALKLQQLKKAKLIQAQKQMNKKLTKSNQQDVLQKKNNLSKKRSREPKIVANASTSQVKKLKSTPDQNNLETIDPLTFLKETSCTETLKNNVPDSNINSKPIPESTTISTINNDQGTTDNNYQDFLTNDYVGEFFDGAGILDDISLPNANYNEKIDFSKMRSPSSTSSVQPSNSTAGFDNLQQYPSNSKSTNENNMTLAKFYNGLDCIENNDDIMRLSTADDVNDHLGGVQDDLENLKSMLRGEGYTLDANTLLNNGTANRIYLSQPLDGDILAKLFGDSDILNPYGYLQLPNESYNNEENAKKGSELMTYQPVTNVDFFDMLVDEPDLLESEKEKDNTVQPSSVMNTPHHA